GGLPPRHSFPTRRSSDLLELFRKQSKPFSNIAFTFLGVIFAVVPFLCFYQLGFLDGAYNYEYPLGFLILLWSSDTGAYLAGRTLDRKSTRLNSSHVKSSY